MVTIDSILSDILKREGWPQVTTRSSDRGGLTKGGITYDSYSRWLKVKGLPYLAPPDFVVSLDEEAARTFLLDSIAGPLMPIKALSDALFTVMVDWATTSGPDDPIRALQTALRGAGMEGVVIDGVYGGGTDFALRANGHLLPEFARSVARSRVRFYVTLALKDATVREFRVTHPESQLENLQGWVNRAVEFL